MRYKITSNCKNVSMNWQKYVFRWEKWNFDSIANSAHTAASLDLGKALNIYIDYFMFYPSRQHVD